jgi:hypothetical protein
LSAASFAALFIPHEPERSSLWSCRFRAAVSCILSVIAYCSARHVIHTDCAAAFLLGLWAFCTFLRLGGNKLAAGLRFHHGILYTVLLCIRRAVFIYVKLLILIFCVVFCATRATIYWIYECSVWFISEMYNDL